MTPLKTQLQHCPCKSLIPPKRYWNPKKVSSALFEWAHPHGRVGGGGGLCEPVALGWAERGCHRNNYLPTYLPPGGGGFWSGPHRCPHRGARGDGPVADVRGVHGVGEHGYRALPPRLGPPVGTTNSAEGDASRGNPWGRGPCSAFKTPNDFRHYTIFTMT